MPGTVRKSFERSWIQPLWQSGERTFQRSKMRDGRRSTLMPDIVLATLNAKYIHAAFGLRYLLANLGELQPRAALVEFDINQRPLDIAEVLLARQPRIIGFGVYIWNVAETTEVIADLKRLRPDVLTVFGGHA